MNAILEIVVIAAAVGIAALFVALRIVKAIQGGRPACCPDTGEAGKLARDSSCAGCTGCGPRG